MTATVAARRETWGSPCALQRLQRWITARLQVLKRSGTPTEQRQAAAIAPVRRIPAFAPAHCLRACHGHSQLAGHVWRGHTRRPRPRSSQRTTTTCSARSRAYSPAAAAQLLKNHHYLLCTLVVWNAAAMEALPIFLDRLANPVTAVILSVTVVLIFGARAWPFASSHALGRSRAHEWRSTQASMPSDHSMRLRLCSCASELAPFPSKSSASPTHCGALSCNRRPYPLRRRDRAAEPVHALRARRRLLLVLDRAGRDVHRRAYRLAARTPARLRSRPLRVDDATRAAAAGARRLAVPVAPSPWKWCVTFRRGKLQKRC